MHRSVTGWLFVAVQAVLLLLLILLPGRDDWATPSGLRLFGMALLVGGLVTILASSATLGRSLTPTPVPVSNGTLRTSGLYQFVRHPIYTGVLAIVLGLTIRSGSFVHLAVAVATMVFFNRKAQWEEERLAEAYPGYPEYAARTPRFVPFSKGSLQRL